MLGCLPLFLILLLGPIFLAALYVNAITTSFERLGLSPEGSVPLFLASLIGADLLNLPLSARCPP